MQTKIIRNYPREQTYFVCECGFIFDYAISCLRCELEHKGIKNARTIGHTNNEIIDIAQSYKDLNIYINIAKNKLNL